MTQSRRKPHCQAWRASLHFYCIRVIDCLTFTMPNRLAVLSISTQLERRWGTLTDARRLSHVVSSEMCSGWADSGCERLFAREKKLFLVMVRSTSCCRSITIKAVFTRVIFNFPHEKSDEIWLEMFMRSELVAKTGWAARKKGWERLSRGRQ